MWLHSEIRFMVRVMDTFRGDTGPWPSRGYRLVRGGIESVNEINARVAISWLSTWLIHVSGGEIGRR